MLGSIDYNHKQKSYFTCGAVSLQVAMQHLQPQRFYDPAEEFLIWREANTVFMHEGFAGTGPYGLALAAIRRGFVAEVWEKDFSLFCKHWNKDLDEKQNQVVEMLDQHDRNAAKQAEITIKNERFDVADIASCITQNKVLLLLNTAFTAGHWTVVLDATSDGVVVFDPDPEDGIKPVTAVSFDEIARSSVCAHTGAMVAVIISNKV